MSRLSVQLEYDRKTAELRTLVEQEAVKLQKAKDAVNSSLQECQALAGRKTALEQTIKKLDQELADKKQYLDELGQREHDLVASSERQLKETEEAIRKQTGTLKHLEEKTADLERIASEIEPFIKQADEIRTRYLEFKQQLGETEAELKKLRIEWKEKEDRVATRQKELEDLRKYVADLYGKLASYVNIAKETLTFINEELDQKDIPIYFGIPEGQIFEINFDNFDKPYEQA